MGSGAAHNAVNSDRSSAGVADTAEWECGSVAVDIAVDRNCSSAGAIRFVKDQWLEQRGILSLKVDLPWSCDHPRSAFRAVAYYPCVRSDAR